MTFSGTKFASVWRDSGTEYQAPHWLDHNENGSGDDLQAGDRQYPVASGKNATIKMTVELKTINGGWPLHWDPQMQLWVAGYGPGNLKTEILCVGRPQGSFSMTYTFTATVPLADYVHSFRPFVMQWRAIWALGCPTYEDPNWRAFGSSSNPLYVTYGKSLSTAYHSLVYNATVSAEGKCTWQDVLNANWTSFSTYSFVWKEAPLYEPTQPTIPTRASKMFYYGSWGTGVYDYENVLKYGDGQCYAWAKMWVAEIKVSGIGEVNPIVYKITPSSGDHGFLINNWSFGAGTSGNPTYPYVATFDGISPRKSSAVRLEDNRYDFIASDFQDVSGTKGQGSGEWGSPLGNANPAADFNTHYLVSANARLYDPSYGTDFATLAQWEAASIAAYFQLQVGAPSSWIVRLNNSNLVEVQLAQDQP